jgi:hypothetical protein
MTGRRSLGVAVAMCALGGCGGSALQPGTHPDAGMPGPDAAAPDVPVKRPCDPPTPEPWCAGGAVPNRKYDILFMIDDSSSMRTSQANIAVNFPAFIDVLKNIPGGLPDLHLAVVTSDMGAGDGSIAGCSGNGDDGVFRYGPGVGCAATNLEANATFIAAPIGGEPNFTGDISDVFQCIANVGDAGCGFEHQLASVARALGADGMPAPDANLGFLRADAYLAIVLLTNEDDCSAPIHSVLYDTEANLNLASVVGPPGNFRCNEFGHLCSQGGGPLARPSRIAPPGDAPVSYDSCVSAEGQGMLTPVGATGFAGQIKALKADPASQILVAAITGPTTPYTVTWQTPPIADTGPWPEMAHSCGSPSDPAGFADPAVRIQQFVGEFGGNGLVESFCQSNYTSALQLVAQRMAGMIAGGGG